MFKRIAIICTGNICRSPYGEFVLRAKAPQLEVISAGLSAMVGQQADPTAFKVAMARNIDMTNHTAQQIRSEIIASNELLLVMDDEHLIKILRQYPEARGKTFKLGKWLGDKNIVDPYKRPAEFFHLVFDEIDRSLEKWLPHLTG